ncbi:MAG: S8 family serine peptidase, partial [Eggerthellaceae bacterium]|nr:S8 family serine peptidase [Eggerthellaceae bacterium]
IDTDVRYDHPDLKESMWTGGEKVAKELGWSTDINGDGVVDDGVAYGFDTYALTADDQTTAGDVDGFGPMDKNGHGTHVAGIVGAQLNNNEGGSGVASGVKIMALRAAGDFFPSSGVFKAFQYVQTAKEMGVNVVAANNSWGGYSVDTLYTLIVDDLHKNGISGEVVTPSGNSSSGTGEKDVLPQTSDPLRDYAKALVVLAVVGAMGTIVAAVQSRRMRVDTKGN